MKRKMVSGVMLTLLLAGILSVTFSSSVLARVFVHDLLIPYVPIASELTIDGEMTEEAWDYAEHFHDFTTQVLPPTWDRTIEYDFYLMHDGMSIYIGVRILDNDFCGYDVLPPLGPYPDNLDIEINDRNDGHFGGDSGNDKKRILVTTAGSGSYQDKYIPLDEKHDITVDGEGAFTFSGIRENGEFGDYCFELRTPIYGKHPEDAELCEGTPFGMTTGFADQEIAAHIGHGYWLVYGSFVLEHSPLPLSATTDMHPDTLNLKSKGRWVTTYIELPQGFDVSEIDISTVVLNDIIEAELHPTEIGDYDTDDIPDLMVKFDRQDVIALLTAGEAILTVTGKVNGIPFEGSDTIRVIGE